MYKDPGFGEYRLNDSKVWDGRQPVLVNVGTQMGEEKGYDKAGAFKETGSRFSDTGAAQSPNSLWRPNEGLTANPDSWSADTYDEYDINANLPHALRLMEQAVQEKAAIRELYRNLARMAQGRDKEMLFAMERDESKQEGLIRRVYAEITNGEIAAPGFDASQKLAYRKGLQSAVIAEQEAVQKYRSILFAMRTRRHINIMTEIVTDELKHIGLLSCLLGGMYGAKP